MIRRHLTAFAVGALLLPLGRGLPAQGVRAPQPAPGPEPHFAFPHIVRRTLPNGLRLLVVENHSVPLVAGRIVLDVDSLLPDPVGKEGLLQFELAMLREGTATATGDQISTQIAQVGGSVFIGNNPSFTVATPDLDRTLALVGDMLSHPSFPQGALERVRSTQLAVLRGLKARAPWTPLRVFASVVRGGVPVRGPTEAGIGAITRDDLVDFHSKYVRPQLATVVLVGDISAGVAAAAVERTFGSWTHGGVDAISSDSSARRPASTTIYLIDRPAATQSFMVVGTLGPARTSPDLPAVDVMNAVLDQVTDSRVGTNLRQRHGFAYSPGNVNVWTRPPGPSVLGANVNVTASKTDSALAEWMSEIKAIGGARPPTDSEMVFARGLVLGQLPAVIETSPQLATRVADYMARNGASLDFYDTYFSRIRAVRPVDVTTVAAKYLDPSHLAIVIAGDRKVIEAPLRAANIAPVVIVDENGKPVP